MANSTPNPHAEYERDLAIRTAERQAFLERAFDLVNGDRSGSEAVRTLSRKLERMRELQTAAKPLTDDMAKLEAEGRNAGYGSIHFDHPNEDEAYQLNAEGEALFAEIRALYETISKTIGAQRPK